MYNLINAPIKINPENIPFKEEVELLFNKKEQTYENSAIYYYNRKDNKWIHMKSSSLGISTHILSGGIFAILQENEMFLHLEYVLLLLNPDNLQS